MPAPLSMLHIFVGSEAFSSGSLRSFFFFLFFFAGFPIFFLMLMPCAGKYILLSACFEYSRHFWQEEVRVLVRGGSCSGETSTQLIYMLPHDGPCHHHSYKYFCTIFRCHTAISPRRFFFFFFFVNFPPVPLSFLALSAGPLHLFNVEKLYSLPLPAEPGNGSLTFVKIFSDS